MRDSGSALAHVKALELCPAHFAECFFYLAYDLMNLAKFNTCGLRANHALKGSLCFMQKFGRRSVREKYCPI